jgi:hypothetical protein
MHEYEVDYEYQYQVGVLVTGPGTIVQGPRKKSCRKNEIMTVCSLSFSFHFSTPPQENTPLICTPVRRRIMILALLILFVERRRSMLVVEDKSACARVICVITMATALIPDLCIIIRSTPPSVD